MGAETGGSRLSSRMWVVGVEAIIEVAADLYWELTGSPELGCVPYVD